MSVYTLTSEHFSIQGSKQKILRVNLPGAYLIFFSMYGDGNCLQFEPIFSQLSTIERRVKFAIIDIKQYRDVTIMSKETNLPITSVPMLAIYVDGIPKAKFNGSRNVQSIQGFITKVFQSSPPPQQFSSGPPPPNIYGGHPDHSHPGKSGRHHAPEISPPSMKGALKGGHTGMVEQEEDLVLQTPDDIVPHNTPWMISGEQ